MFRTRLPGSDIVLWRRRRLARNSLGIVAAIRCEAGGGGTVLRVTLRGRYYVATFLTLWAGAVIDLGVLIYQHPGPDPVSVTNFLPLLMVVAGIGFVVGGRLEATGEGPALIDFVRQTTLAENSGS